MKILIDPSIIWFHPYTKEKFNYLVDVTDLIEKMLKIKHISCDLYLLFLQKLIKDPFDNYRETHSKKNQIVSRLFSMLDEEKVINLRNYTEDMSILSEKYILSYNDDVNKYLYKILTYIKKNNIECLLFLSLDNHDCVEKIGDTIHFIRHIYEETNSYLSVIISNGEFLEDDSILSPTLNEPLPNKWLTEKYQAIRKEIIKSGKASNALFLDFGREVSLRNGYTFDEYLTRINNNAIREIFKSKTKPTIYLSTDVEHGAIEVFDDKPEHQGEYSYTGNKKPNSKDPKKHKIILHK